MKISEQPMDRMVTNDDGDMIHCRQITVYNDAYALAGWGRKGGFLAFGKNQTTNEWITDPGYKVRPWSERQEILASKPQQLSLV